MTTNQILIGVGLILVLAVGSQVLASKLRIPALIVLLLPGGAWLRGGYASWGEARGAAFQLLLNVTVLIAMGALVLRVQRVIWGARERAEASQATDGGP